MRSTHDINACPTLKAPRLARGASTYNLHILEPGPVLVKRMSCRVHIGRHLASPSLPAGVAVGSTCDMNIDGSAIARLAQQGVAYAPQIAGAAQTHGLDP